MSREDMLLAGITVLFSCLTWVLKRLIDRVKHNEKICLEDRDALREVQKRLMEISCGTNPCQSRQPINLEYLYKNNK